MFRFSCPQTTFGASLVSRCPLRIVKPHALCSAPRVCLQKRLCFAFNLQVLPKFDHVDLMVHHHILVWVCMQAEAPPPVLQPPAAA